MWWLPIFAFTGLVFGVIARFVFHEPAAGEMIWFATLLIGGAPIVLQTIRGMLKGVFASDIVALLAIVTAAILGQAFAGAVVVLMQSGGEAIENYGLKKATSSLEHLLARAPKRARRKRNEQLEEVDVSDVQIGDILIVRPGDLIPVDGTIVSGVAEIDASAITGEPLTHSRREGESLLSGSVNVTGAIEMRADKLAQDSQYNKIVLLVKKAQEEKAPIQRLADRYAIYFTPLTLVMGLLGFLWTHEAATFLAVLVVATPCPLILATPLAILGGINRAANGGIIVKGGGALEQVASAQAVLFDKTGTLTFGVPHVETVVGDETLYYAASLDQLSSHSVAKAIVAHALSQNVKLSLPTEFQEFPGQGVSGKVNGKLTRVGSLHWIEQQVGPIELDPAVRKLDPIVVLGHGYLLVSDLMRPNVPSLIRKLYKLGVKEVILITGDGEKNGAAIASQAGIERFAYNLLPEGKVHFVQEVRKIYDPVIMVGDGINDAPALASATVGIAMGAHGTAISAEAADLILLVDDVGKVAEAIAIGKHMLKIAKQSIFIGMGLSFCLMVVAAWGHILPAVGAGLQEIIDVAVILNALRARELSGSALQILQER